jgi:hypothetical protein
LGSYRNKIFLCGDLPLIFQRVFTTVIEKVEKLLNGERQTKKFQQVILYQIGVKESNGDVISGLARSLAAEIDIPPVSAKGKPLIPSKWYKIDGKYY